MDHPHDPNLFQYEAAGTTTAPSKRDLVIAALSFVGLLVLLGWGAFKFGRAFGLW